VIFIENKTQQILGVMFSTHRTSEGTEEEIGPQRVSAVE
jgi:hypothetical protein